MLPNLLTTVDRSCEQQPIELREELAHQISYPTPGSAPSREVFLRGWNFPLTAAFYLLVYIQTRPMWKTARLSLRPPDQTYPSG